MERFIYNDFCVDVDSESGRSVFIICENYIQIKKCCKLKQILKKTNNRFECFESANFTYLTDINQIFKNYDQLPNIEFITENSINLEEYIFKVNASESSIVEMEDLNSCYDKLNDVWILLDVKKQNESIRLVSWMILFVAIILFLTLVICILVCGFKNRVTSNRDWRTDMKKIIDELKEKLSSDKIQEQREPKPTKVDSTAGTSKHETGSTVIELSNGGQNEDLNKNGIENIPLFEGPSVQELMKKFESNKAVDSNDEDKNRKSLIDTRERRKSRAMEKESTVRTSKIYTEPLMILNGGLNEEFVDNEHFEGPSVQELVKTH